MDSAAYNYSHFNGTLTTMVNYKIISFISHLGKIIFKGILSRLKLKAEETG